MKLKRIASLLLSAVIFASTLTVSAAPACAAAPDSEVSEAAKLGFITAAQAKETGRNATQKEVAEMITAVIKKFYGKTGKFLPDRVKYADEKLPASRFYFASTAYFSMREMTYSPNYDGYMEYMEQCASNYDLQPDSSMLGFRDDGTAGDISIFDDCIDKSDIDGNEKVGAKYVYMNDFGTASAAQYVRCMYDRVSGLPVMSLDSKNYFNPQKNMTVGEAAAAAFRLYRAIEPDGKSVKISKVGSYDKKIITDELLNKKSSLPEASNQKLPVWRGVMDDRMSWVMHTALDSHADKIFREGDIKAIADTGFNHLSVFISFPWLQGWDFKEGYVNETRLKELDKIIAMCMKYDVHVTIENLELPGMTSNTRDPHDNITEKLSDPKMIKEYAKYWGMLAKRYKGIDNKYLAFNLMCEPEFDSDEQYKKLLGPSVEAIFKEDKTRVIIADVHSDKYYGTEMAKMGVALSYHLYEPRAFCAIDDPRYHSANDYKDEKFLSKVTWPYKENGKTINAADTFDLLMGDREGTSLNDIKKIAEKYGVGFMVGEFGIFGGKAGEIGRYRYSDKTIKAYLKDMIAEFEKEEIGWVYGVSHTQWGILQACPAVKSAKYTKLENSTDYYDETLGGIFKEAIGVPKTPSSVKAKASGGKVKVSWKKVSGADGYEVLMSTSKDGVYSVVKTVSGSKSSASVSAVKGKTCYFKVRSFKTKNGVKIYSALSEAKSVKT